MQQRPAQRLVGLCCAVLFIGGCTTAVQMNETPPSAPASSSVLANRRELTTPRAVHHATVLQDSRVLFTGGCTLPGCEGFEAGRATELYNPKTQRFEPGPMMTEPRASGTATLLVDGRVLLTGGYPGEGQPPSSTAEVFDPGTGGFTPVGSMAAPRAGQTATRLPDGRVLIAGGVDETGQALTSTEMYDPDTDTFVSGPKLTAPRSAHAAVAVGDNVVVVGGIATGAALASTDVLANGQWTAGPRMLVPRVKHAAAALPGGRILVIGGSTSVEGRQKLASTELVDLSSAKVEFGPDLSEGEYKLDGTVAVLPDGRIAVAGGTHVDLYDPDQNRFSTLEQPVMERRSFRTATFLRPSRLLVAGGYDDAIAPTKEALLVQLPAPR